MCIRDRNLAGLVVTKRDGNENRMKKMEVATSTDGATWFPLAAMTCCF